MKGLSQEELGKLLHISRQTISKWESNQSSPDIQSCKAMADVFGISLEELLDESKKIKTDQSTNHRNMSIIFGIVIFLAFIMESYVAVKMSERMDALEEANSSLQQQINDFYDYQNREPITLDINSICTYFSGYISDIKQDSYNINIDLILRNYQDNTIAQVIFKTDKDTYTLSLNKEEDHFNGTINLPIQTLQSAQLISQTNGETNSEVLDIDVNFENYLDEDTVMVEYTYTNEMGIKKKQEATAQLKKNWQGYYLAWK